MWKAWAVAAKDLRVEARSSEWLTLVAPFAMTLLIVFGLSFGPDSSALRAAAPALVWLAVLLAGTLALRRSFEAEAEDGALEGLVLSPLDRGAIYLGKVAAVAVQLIILEALTLLGVAFFFGLDIGGDLLPMVAAFALGTIGLAAVGTLFAALSSRARAREALFPLLLLPLVIPVLLAGIRSMELALAGRGESAASGLGLLGAFGLLFLAAGTLLFEHLLEE